MKADPSRDPLRWRERDVDAHTLEARAAVVADAARTVQPLGAQAVSRIRATVLASAGGRAGFVDGPRFSIVTRAAIGLLLVLICAATADGAGILWRRHLQMVRAQRASTPPPAAAPPEARRPVHRAAAASDERPPETAPETGSATPVPPLASDQVATTAPLRHIAARARVSAAFAPEIAPLAPEVAPLASGVPLAPEVVPLAPEPAPPRAEAPDGQRTKPTEAGMVAAALAELRQQGDPRAALVTLDAYARAFPHGVLETEARRTRVEAVIRLDDKKAALALLDTMPGLSDEPGTDLLLTRAELRAAAGRFREALGDFTQAVEGAGGAAAASERALYGRAVCFGRLAKGESARADLLAYQRRFPSGRFAAEVGRLLSEPAPADRP